MQLLTQIIRYALKYLLDISWIFLLGVALAALIKTFKLDKRMYHTFSRNETLTIFLAVGAGLISPLCSCGILPVVISLFEAGIPTAPIMALLITSPLMSPSALWLTALDLGFDLAYAKLICAALIGITTGFVTLILTRQGFFNRDETRFTHTDDTEKPCAISTAIALQEQGKESQIVLADNKLRFFWNRFKELFFFMGKFILLATIIESLLVNLLPLNLLLNSVAGQGVASVFVMTILGIPLPTHQVAAVPILHGLIDAGLNKGAALAFLIAGPVTSIPALTALGAMTSKKLLWLYLIMSVTSAVTFGTIYLFL